MVSDALNVRNGSIEDLGSPPETGHAAGIARKRTCQMFEMGGKLTINS
jgi:hypothetical protein